MKTVPVAVFSVEIFFALVGEKKMPAGLARGLAKISVAQHIYLILESRAHQISFSKGKSKYT